VRICGSEFSYADPSWISHVLMRIIENPKMEKKVKLR